MPHERSDDRRVNTRTAQCEHTRLDPAQRGEKIPQRHPGGRYRALQSATASVRKLVGNVGLAPVAIHSAPG